MTTKHEAGLPARLFPEGCSRAQAVAALRAAFVSIDLDSPGLDARLLVRAALAIDDTALLVRPDTPLAPADAARLDAFARRRLAREPIARILGQAEFWGLPFRLGPDTLVPRPDTETLVAAALAALPREARIADLGTGSGCILTALLCERPDATGLGADRSAAALAVARGNAVANGVGGRALFVVSDWSAALGGRFDCVVSNPPYIARAEIDALDPEVARFDPRSALDGGPDGLDAYRAILADAARILAPEGTLLLEIGYDQRDTVAALARANGFAVLRDATDLGGHLRVLVLRVAR